MRNRYGEKLRGLISEGYSVDSVVMMREVNAFEDEVSAYPAVTVLRRGSQGATRVVMARSTFNRSAGERLVGWLAGDEAAAPTGDSFEAAELKGWFNGCGHWPEGSPRTLELLADLEERFRPLEDFQTGTRIGIGLASGCDEVFIVREAAGVEESRLLPMVTAADIAAGEPSWGGRYLVNPWEDGRLVDLADFPGLRAYLESQGTRVRSRHVARRRPAAWYRTIDRVDPALTGRPKLLLPDIKAFAHPVLERGKLYPHHNLYHVTSNVWDLEVLGGLLLSDAANLFVGAYCVKMRGGTYRFQAQYLRKIRVPDPAALDDDQSAALAAAFRARDRRSATAAAAAAYGIDESDLSPVATAA